MLNPYINQKCFWTMGEGKRIPVTILEVDKYCAVKAKREDGTVTWLPTIELTERNEQNES